MRRPSPQRREASRRCARPSGASPAIRGQPARALQFSTTSAWTARREGARLAKEAGAPALLSLAYKAFPDDKTLRERCLKAIGSIALLDPEERAVEMGRLDNAPQVAEKAAAAAAGGGGQRRPPAGGVKQEQPAEQERVQAAQAARPGEATRSSAPSPPPRPARVCHNCGAEAGGSDPQGRPVRKLRACGGCRAVHYCSVECSEQDWRAHKVECKQRQQEQQQ